MPLKRSYPFALAIEFTLPMANLLVRGQSRAVVVYDGPTSLTTNPSVYELGRGLWRQGGR